MWSRYVVWLKREKAYAVLDRVTVNQDAKLLLKQRWNGLGEITPKADGAAFAQQGPAMRFQGYTANNYNYADDYARSIYTISQIFKRNRIIYVQNIVW